MPDCKESGGGGRRKAGHVGSGSATGVGGVGCWPGEF